MRSVNFADIQANLSVSVAQAMEQITKNKQGCLFLIDDSGVLKGMVTDGDIRRHLTGGGAIADGIENCMNKDFVSVTEHDTREKILKLLDQKIRIIPVLDAKGKLSEFVTRDHFPLDKNSRQIAFAKSPVRVSFAGGGSDLTEYFCDHGGIVLNSTINLFSHSTLKRLPDRRVKVYSYDLKEGFEIESIDKLNEVKGLDLIKNILKLINPQFGFELEVYSDFPVGSGLGGSAVVLSSIIGCFNQFNPDPWDRYEIAEMAFQAERLGMNIAGGWQDQYATVFGGFNFMEFKKESNLVHPLRVEENVILGLEQSALLCYTGQGHNSGDIMEAQKESLSSEKVKELLQKNKEITLELKKYLLKGKVIKIGECLDRGWQVKRQMSGGVSSQYLDEIYSFAKEQGAIGGKLLGAGAGGYFFFICEPMSRNLLREKLNEKYGIVSQHIRFDLEGLQTCKVKG